MTFNTIDISPVNFAFVDDRLLLAQCGHEIVGKSLSEIPENLNFVMDDLINVVDCVGPFSDADPAKVTITDVDGNLIKDWKFACKRLDLSFNFFNQGYWLHIEVGKFKQKVPLHWELYKDRILPDGVTFH